MRATARLASVVSSTLSARRRLIRNFRPTKMRFATIKRFSKLCLEAGLSSDFAASAWSELQMRYSESHRHYHNLKHIDQMLSWLESTGASSPALELAIWYHDPRSEENELLSADVFAAQFGGLVASELCADVRRLILATDHRRDRPIMGDETLLIDIDLSIQAAPDAEYDHYCAAIRQEYAFVPSDHYRRARCSVMSKFLTQPIYFNEPFTSFETRARANIEREIEQLLSENGGER